MRRMCDRIKENEADVSNIDFELQLKEGEELIISGQQNVQLTVGLFQNVTFLMDNYIIS